MSNMIQVMEAMTMEDVDRLSFLELVRILDPKGDEEKTLAEQSNEWDISILTEKDTALLLIGLYVRKKFKTIEKLIADGININARTWTYETVLDTVLDAADFKTAKMLIDAGANIFQINSYGDCRLVRVLKARSPKSKEFLLYLMEKGLNPYNQHVINSYISFTTSDDEVINATKLQNWSSFEEADNDYWKYIWSGNYDIALTILERILNNIGPLQDNAPVTVFIEDTLEHYRIVLQILNQTEPANSIADFMYDNTEVKNRFAPNNRDSLHVNAAFSGNRERFKEYNNFIRRIGQDDLTVYGSFILEYLFLMRSGKRTTGVVTKIKNRLNRHGGSLTGRMIAELFVTKGNEKEIETYLENSNFLPNVQVRMTNYYMIYLIDKKEYTAAKFFAYKLKTLDRKKVELHDYYFTLMLLKYVEELEMSAE